MTNEAVSSHLTNLLNRAIARELQVSIQYMFQHAIGAGPGGSISGRSPAARRSKFVASHSMIWFPGVTLKKIAIAEMRHAEAIAERVVRLGGEPTTEPDVVTIGETPREMLEINREEERGAIELYREIVAVARTEQDVVTMELFQRILSDEEKHHQVFSDLLQD